MRVILNLVRNALQSARERGIMEGPDFVPQVTVRSFIEGDRIVIAIRDNGVGIAPEHRERLFQPFFTTKSAGEGTGLGLSISYEIVTQHGGEITVDSVPFAYAEFRIVLPKDINALISDLESSTGKGVE
jgi:signal transduction histidine kinase